MVTHIGTEGVKNYIKQLGGTAFKIYFDNSKAPLYTSNTKDTIKEFEEFSTNILNSDSENLIYRIVVYKGNTGRSNGASIIGETYYQYYKDKEEPVNSVSGMGNSMTDMFSLMHGMMKIVQPFANQKAENVILKKEIEEREQEPENSQMTQLLGAVLPALLNKPAALAGVDVAPLQTEVINEALAILVKNDDNIANDLMKLATLSEENPVLFNTLLTQLRSL